MVQIVGEWLFLVYVILACHFVGDYVLQIDFIAKTKGENWWHLFVHCVLYSLPFAYVFSMDWKIIFIIVTHFIVDASKARYDKISYGCDQVLHLMFACIYLV